MHLYQPKWTFVFGKLYTLQMAALRSLLTFLIAIQLHSIHGAAHQSEQGIFA